jgi:hypothetical protein
MSITVAAPRCPVFIHHRYRGAVFALGCWLTAVLLASAPAFGDDHDHPQPEHAPAWTAGENGEASAQHSTHGADSHFHRNLIGVFAGVTHEGRRENDAAFGIEYERRFDERFGSGLIVEHTFGDGDFWVVAVPLYMRAGRWRFAVAPGVEDSRDRDAEFLMRFMVGYDFRLGGGWDLAPGLMVDFVDGEDVWVAGLGLSKGF